MRILSVGLEVEHEALDYDSFDSSRSCLDYDLLLWNPNEILYDYSSKSDSPKYLGLKNLSDEASAKALGDIVRRKKEISEMLELGRSVVVVTSPPQRCYVDTGKREFSGTGRNRQVTRMVEEVDFLSSLPIENTQTTEALGKSIEFKGGEPFAAFWKNNKKYLSYKAYFRQPVGTPLFFVKGTQRVVGSYSEIGKGILLFIPSFLDEEHWEQYDLAEGEAEEVSERFVGSLITLIEELKKGAGDFELPAWTAAYALPGELEMKKEQRNLNDELNEVLFRISKQKELAAELESYKTLFAGTGKALETQIRRVFEELGFSVKEGEPGRDDLILRYEDKVAVVEVKGVSKSAGEKHAAQLEKWVSEYHVAHNVHPKGILVVNTYRDAPLENRSGYAFPDQMLPFSKNRGHCLITTLQLLGLYLDCKDDDAKKAEMVNRLFTTEGVFTEYQNWSDYLTMQNETLDASE